MNDTIRRIAVGAILLLLIISILAADLAGAQDATPDATAEATAEVTAVAVPLPAQIFVNNPGMMPEGIAWDASRSAFLLGSLAQGSVSIVDADGVITPLVEGIDGSAVGIEVDAERGRLLVAITNQATGAGALGAYDLATGAALFVADLSAANPDAAESFPNDVAVDADGNAYVSDSAAGVFYRVDTAGSAEVWLSDPSFVGQFVLNGITYSADGGYLLAVRGEDLLRIDPATAAYTVVASDDNLRGDGIILLDRDTLVQVTGQQVKRVETDDDFESAAITGAFIPEPRSATTAAVLPDESVYIIYADFSNPDAGSYPIQRVLFSDVSAADATPEATP